MTLLICKSIKRKAVTLIGARVQSDELINHLRMLLGGPDFREPLERLREHLDNYDFEEAREPLAQIAAMLNIALER